MQNLVLHLKGEFGVCSHSIWMQTESGIQAEGWPYCCNWSVPRSTYV